MSALSCWCNGGEGTVDAIRHSLELEENVCIKRINALLSKDQIALFGAAGLGWF